MSGLSDYIKRGLSQGYSIDNLRSVLLSRGYPEKEIESAIAEAYGKKKKYEISPILILAGMILLILIAYFTFSIFLSGDVDPGSISLDLRLPKKSFEKNEELRFSSSISAEEKTGADISYKVIDKDTGTVELAKSNRILIGKESFSEGIFSLNSLEEGDYDIKAELFVGKIKVSDSGSFSIIKQEYGINKTDKNITGNSSEDNNLKDMDKENNKKDKGNDGPVDSEPEENIISDEKKLTGKENFTEEKDKEIYEIIKISKEDLDKAVSLCQEKKEKDSCLSSIARETKVTSICTKIEGPAEKDGCYSNVALETGDKELCQMIQDQYLRKSCRTLSER